MGTTVGRYVLEEPLGAGGMGEVYLARDLELGRAVALKLLSARAVLDVEARAEWTARMKREARAAAALNHPNIVAVYDVGEHEGAPFIVMELVQGRSLRALIGDPSVPLVDRIDWLTQVARALGAAHAAGLVHRDVKPDNVMVRSDGTVKVLDFGIARTQDRRVDASAPTGVGAFAALTSEGTIIGTPRYMAPEQLWGEPLDGRADQFAWALTAYELLWGQPAFDASDAVRLITAMTTTDAPPLGERCPDVPPEVAAAVDRALRRDRTERFDSMEAVVEALSRVGTGPTQLAPRVAAARPQSPAETKPDSSPRPEIEPAAISAAPLSPAPRRASSQRGATLLFAALLVVGVAGALTVWLASDRHAPALGFQGSASATSSSAAPAGSAEPPLRHVCDREPEDAAFKCNQSRAWCDAKERPIACCAEGLVPKDESGTCVCAPGGSTIEAAQKAGCATPEPIPDRLARVKRMIRGRFAELRACFDDRAQNPAAFGTVSMFVEVDPEGRVFRTRINGTSLPDAGVQSCMVDVFKTFRFPPPADGHVVMTYPIVFDSEPEASGSAPAAP